MEDDHDDSIGVEEYGKEVYIVVEGSTRPAACGVGFDGCDLLTPAAFDLCCCCCCFFFVLPGPLSSPWCLE
jgi:hypothetical protein